MSAEVDTGYNRTWPHHDWKPSGGEQQSVFALFEIEVEQLPGSPIQLRAQCSCGAEKTVTAGRDGGGPLERWLYEHARCPE